MKAAHRFAEDHCEVDRRSVGRVRLASGLVDGHRRRGGIISHSVVRAGAVRIGIAGRILRLTRRDCCNHRAGPRHAADRHIVGRAAASHHRSGRASRAAKVTSPVKSVTGSLKTTVKLIGEALVGSTCRRLVDRHRRRGGVVRDGVVGAGGGRVAC